MKDILLIGCGHMGEALFTSWLKVRKYNLTIIDPIKYNFLKKKYKNKRVVFLKSISLLKKSTNFDFIILATKPKDLVNVLNELEIMKIQNQPSIVSIIAGKKIKEIQKKLSNINNFFRVMPNIPAFVGESMNCIVANNRATKIKKNQVIKLFSFSGKSLFLENEDQIDMATAISGSGPGFVFNLINTMEKSAMKLGFKKLSKNFSSSNFQRFNTDARK